MKNQTQDIHDDPILTLRGLLSTRVNEPGARRRVHVIINPAAGKDQPILQALNTAFRAADFDWDVFVTKESGDGKRFAQEAVQAGADIVAVFGGDGSVMDVANGLVGSQVPMAIIPGGTANVMSRELGIPVGIVESTALVVNPDALIRKIDIGRVGDQCFLLRASMGFEAAMVEGADRELKDRVGLLAYTFSALQALANPEIARYRLTLDGQVVETEGLTCIIANSGNIGISGISLAPGVDISDGLLDVIVVTKADLPSLVALTASVVGGVENPDTLQHWQAKEITVETDRPQSIQLDGEMAGTTPVQAHVIPHSVHVIVPPGSVIE